MFDIYFGFKKSGEEAKGEPNKVMMLLLARHPNKE